MLWPQLKHQRVWGVSASMNNGPRFNLATNRDDKGPFAAEGEGSADYFLTKIDLGMRQWTPLRMSTTWETRQSPTMEVSA